MKKLLIIILFSTLLLLTPFITLGEKEFEEERESYTLEEAESIQEEKFITRGEFSHLLAKSLNLLPIEDVTFRDLGDYPERGSIAALHKKGILKGYPEGNFLPTIQLTRGEAATIITRVLELHHEEHRPRFSEEPHWASNNIDLLVELGLMNHLDPEEYMTKREAQEIIQGLQNLETYSGRLTETYPLSQKIALEIEEERVLVDYPEEALVYRNNRDATFGDLKTKDKVFIIQEKNGEVVYLKAIGILDQREIAMELSELLGGILSWQEVEALAYGNWEVLGDRALFEIEDYLSKEGLTPNEIQALLTTDWETLSELGKNRMVEALSMETGVPRDLMRAIIDWNWDDIMEITQLELLQLLVEEILDPSYLNL